MSIDIDGACMFPQGGEELPHLLLHLRWPGRQEEAGPL